MLGIINIVRFLFHFFQGLIDVFNATMKHIYKHPRTPEHDQQVFNGYLNDKLKRDGNTSVKMYPLDKNMFPIGSDYFVRGESLV